jgi:hypothetical protein
LVFAGENADQLQLRYGNIAAASIGAIQRRLLVLYRAYSKTRKSS